MTISEYDITNIDKILQGQGDWFSAHLLRFLDEVVFKLDGKNFMTLWTAYPWAIIAIYRYHGWTHAQIENFVENRRASLI